ncbi:MAG: flagellar export chaperone FliS [Methylococcaceae bacterium]|jgi:flagellar secretion chaperone FliS
MNVYGKAVTKSYANISLETSVSTANPHQLITLLLEAILVSIVKAKYHMQKQEIEEKGKAINHAVTMIDGGLRGGLDFDQGGELAKNLDELYLYIIKQLLTGNLKNQVELLDEAYQLLKGIKEAWVTIGQNLDVPTEGPRSISTAS